jgi:hypothetical protein
VVMAVVGDGGWWLMMVRMAQNLKNNIDSILSLTNTYY